MKKIFNSILISFFFLAGCNSYSQTVPEKFRDRSRESKPMELEGRPGNPITIVRSNNSMTGALLKYEPISLTSSADDLVIILSRRIVFLEEKIKLQESKIAELEGVKK